jgi:hypothetical protein
MSFSGDPGTKKMAKKRVVKALQVGFVPCPFMKKGQSPIFFF